MSKRELIFSKRELNFLEKGVNIVMEAKQRRKKSNNEQ